MEASMHLLFVVAAASFAGLLALPLAAANHDGIGGIGGDGPLGPVPGIWEDLCNDGSACIEGCAPMAFGQVQGYQGILCIHVATSEVRIGVLKGSDGNCIINIPIGLA